MRPKLPGVTVTRCIRRDTGNGHKWPRRTPRPASEPSTSSIPECMRNATAVMASPWGFMEQLLVINQKDFFFFFFFPLPARCPLLSEWCAFQSVLKKSFKAEIAAWESKLRWSPGDTSSRCLVPHALPEGKVLLAFRKHCRTWFLPQSSL